jgi:hypothetical protein
VHDAASYDAATKAVREQHGAQNVELVVFTAESVIERAAELAVWIE